MFTGTNIDIVLKTGLDVSQATEAKIKYEKPDGTEGEFIATTDGKEIKYSTSVNDIDQQGRWKFQAIVTLGAKLLKGDITTFQFKQPI